MWRGSCCIVESSIALQRGLFLHGGNGEGGISVPDG